MGFFLPFCVRIRLTGVRKLLSLDLSLRNKRFVIIADFVWFLLKT